VCKADVGGNDGSGTPMAVARRARASSAAPRAPARAEHVRARAIRVGARSFGVTAPWVSLDSSAASTRCWRRVHVRATPLACVRHPVPAALCAPESAPPRHRASRSFAASLNRSACEMRSRRLPPSQSHVELNRGNPREAPSAGLKVYSGVTPTVGFGCPPAVMIPASVTPHCARARSRLGW